MLWNGAAGRLLELISASMGRSTTGMALYARVASVSGGSGSASTCCATACRQRAGGAGLCTSPARPWSDQLRAAGAAQPRFRPVLAQRAGTAGSCRPATPDQASSHHARVGHDPCGPGLPGAEPNFGLGDFSLLQRHLECAAGDPGCDGRLWRRSWRRRCSPGSPSRPHPVRWRISRGPTAQRWSFGAWPDPFKRLVHASIV